MHNSSSTVSNILSYWNRIQNNSTVDLIYVFLFLFIWCNICCLLFPTTSWNFLFIHFALLLSIISSFFSPVYQIWLFFFPFFCFPFSGMTIQNAWRLGYCKDVSIHLWMIQFIKYFSQIWKKINHIAQYHSMKNFP